ncbi:IS1380 family transposase [Halotia branconii]|uniref:IS1380 family transposase n=1 Tax=Halotia branconii CENA392 TaxID=1539056 RepID=A0AAJ6PAV0_9CYAN|nr:IS1380 family transposase [Halotia branconii]WGV23788.1 IS1380 family transposase [Halotia branconii CENA392]WGV27132.1 IS1380 family transposase [Halotia branconii CENA392]WGV28663.1 IS1380 family transposase [Halotia branconii CENA392]
MTPTFTDRTPKQFKFSGEKSHPIVVNFQGGTVTSDAGLSLIAEIDRKLEITSKFAQCFQDYRQPNRVDHSIESLIKQRIYGLVMGYEDLNDHEELRQDPMFALAVLKTMGIEDEPTILAGKSTLNRLEHCPEDVEQGADSRYHKIGHCPSEIESLFVKIFLESHAKEPRQIILDLDVTDDLVHGSQEQVFFNTYYGGYCYAPLYIFCGKHLLAAKLRPSNVDPAFGALSELQRVIKQIRQQWKNVEILVRGDSAYSRDDIMTWCESQPGLDYVFGLAQNSRLIGMTTTIQSRASLEFEQKLSTAVSFLETVFKPDEQLPRLACDLIDNSIWYKSLDYQTRESWSRSRRVVCKVEYGAKGTNIRFVVTTLATNKVPPSQLYKQKYCQRGEMENRFKEQQLELFSDRTSTHTFPGNQLRLWFSSLAYVLMNALRQKCLTKTELQNATVGTIRTKLLKLGALITVNTRCILIAITSSCPYKNIFATAHRRLRMLTNTA